MLDDISLYWFTKGSNDQEKIKIAREYFMRADQGSPRAHKIPCFKRSISLKIVTIATAIWWECSASCFVELT